MAAHELRTTSATTRPSDLFVESLPTGVLVASGEPLSPEADAKLAERFPELDWERPSTTAGSPPPSDEDTGRLAPRQPPSLPCVREDNNFQGRRENDNHTWRINYDTFPGNLDSNQTIIDMVDGMDGWADTPRTDCAFNIGSTFAEHDFAGDTDNVPDMDSDGTCNQFDGENVWGFRPITVGDTLAKTCVFYFINPFADDEVSEADVAFDNTWDWGNETNECNGAIRKYMVADVATHEAGHIYGAGHVEQVSEQTMVPETDACTKAHYTLGKGDLLFLDEHYDV